MNETTLQSQRNTEPVRPAAGPVSPEDRAQSLDVLRGVAVLGILVMNIQSFSMINAAYSNPTAYGNLTGANFAIWLLGHLFADGKFITLFSALFGAGIVLMAERAQRAGRSPAALHYRRMVWLMIIGAVHGYLFWFGDVLFIYAFLGMCLYPCRRLSPAPLLALGMLFICVGGGIVLYAGWNMASWTSEQLWSARYDWAPTERQIRDQLAILRAGLADQVPYRAQVTFYFHRHMIPEYFFWRIGGTILLGMAVYKWGLMTGTRSTRFYAWLAAAGFLLGLPVIAYGVYYNFQAEWDLMTSYHQGSLFNYGGSLLAAAGWLGLVMAACRQPVLTPWFRPLAAVGRMALTNYLMQTLICTTLFYGHGFGLYGHVERTGQFGIVMAIWTVQLIVSPLWLRWFRFGPVEWLWRSLTYWRIQPLRNRPAVDE